MKLLTNALLRKGVPQDAAKEIVAATLKTLAEKELPKPKGKLAINEIASYYFYLKQEALKWVSENKIEAPWAVRIKEWA